MFIESKLLENSAVFSMTLKAWRNVRKADKTQIQTDTDKEYLKLSKMLIDSPEYEAITSFQSKIREWTEARSVPSFFKKGLCLFKMEMIETVDEYLRGAIEEQKTLVENFLREYPGQKEIAVSRLNGQYRETDYLSIEEMRTRFGITWNWMKLGIPDNLPQQIFEAEKEKAEKMWADAADQITMTLRKAFKELIDHAVDRLKIEPGAKKKIFRDTFLPNIQEFIETFNMRNLTNDNDLKDLVEKAQSVLSSVGDDTQSLRSDKGMRNFTARKFEEIKTVLDTMIMEKPARQFAFDEE